MNNLKIYDLWLKGEITFREWMEVKVNECGSLSNFCKMYETGIPYRTVQKWWLNKNMPPEWAQHLLIRFYGV